MIKIAKLICKSAYITSLEHVFNTLEYAGNKIDRQEAIFEVGTILEQDGCTKLQLTSEQEQSIKSVRLYYKDGGSKEIDWLTYQKLVSSKEEKITVAKLETVEDEIPGEDELEWAHTEHKEFHDLKDLDVDKYLGYIANRDGAVKEDGHGLFGINGNISMEDARAMAEEHQDSIKWTHIISIRGDDGDKTGFNNRNAWRDLVLAKAPELAKIYNISLENLVVNAAYHQNTDNDHVHVIMYSKDKREGFVKGGKDGMKRATEKMKSLFLNDIFKGDVTPLKELITQQRTDIKEELKNHLVSISKSDITDEKMVNLFLSLSQDLSHHKGKCDYGYLKPERKEKVNNFLRYTLDSNENLSALFTELMGSKRAYIAMYNQEESKIDNLLEEAREKIFHPDKGQAALQNIIVHAIADYNKEKAMSLEKSSGRDNKIQDMLSHQNDVAVGLTDGATKEKNSAYAEDCLDASDSIFFDVPPPPENKSEPLPTMDAFRNLGNLEESESLEPLPPDTKAPEDWYDLSEIRERIAKTLVENKVSETTAQLFEDELELSEDELDFLSYDGSTPRLYDEELEWDDVLLEIDVPLEESESPEESIKIFESEIAANEKITLKEVSGQATKGKKSSGGKQKNTEMSPYYELSKLIYRNISKAAYQTCSNLFNPKAPNTALQNELLAQLQEMQRLSKDEKKKSKEYQGCAVKAFQIMMTDTEFYNAFTGSMDNNTHKFLVKHNFSAESKKAVAEYQKATRIGDKLNSAHWYPQFFSDNLDDQQYFQLMKAYEEFNKPLRKDMRKNIIEHLDEVTPVFREIRELKYSIPNYLKDDKVNEYIRNKISEIWATVADTPEYQVFVDNNLEVFEEHMEPSVVDEYKERFKTTLENVGQLMRPHFYVITQAEHLDELQLSEAFKNKELFAPVKSSIKKCLDNSITNDSFSSLFLKQELLKDADSTKEILRCLYAQENLKPVIDKWAENVIKTSGVEDVTTYYESFQAFLRGEPCEHENLFNYSKLTNYIRYYKDSYVEQAYTQIKKAMQPEIPKNHVFKLLSNSLAQFPEEWKQLHSICEQIKDTETEENVAALKQEQQKLISQIGQKSIYKDEEFLEYIALVNQAFQKHSGDNNIALSLESRFLHDMYSGDAWTAPNGYISFFAQFVPENLIKEKLKDKELFAPVKSVIKQCLDNSITNDSFSSLFLKQELLKDAHSTKEILRCLYSQQDIRPIVDKWAENVIKASGVEDVTTYYENFQAFLRGEPCEYDNLFNYSKLTNYIRYYKDSYVEQAYTQIKKLVNTDDLKKHLSEVFEEDFPKNPEQWVNLYQHMKNRPNQEDENELKEYQKCSEKLVSKLFQRILHEDEDINSYIAAVNKEFYQHAGDDNIALTLENRFLTDLYSGDLFMVPNMQISFFAQRIPNELLKNILKMDESKTLLKPIYKDIKEAIYTKLLSPDNNQVKEKLSHLQELAKELESSDYINRPQLVVEVQNIICDIIEEIETPELTDYFEKLKEHLKVQVAQTVPKEVQGDVTTLIDNMRSGGLYMPYNYIIFAMGAEPKATYGKAVAWEMKEDIQNLNHLIYQNFYEILSHSKIKREASPIYQIIKQLINTPLPSNPTENFERKQIHTKILAEFRQNPDFEKTYQQLENTFYQKLHDCCRIDDVSKLFESIVVDGDFGSINSTIEFMASNTESVIKRINKQKASQCVKLLIGAIAYSLYNETNHQMQRNLSQKNTLSRGLNRFITKKVQKQVNEFISY